jgi:hypothetical protein
MWWGDPPGAERSRTVSGMADGAGVTHDEGSVVAPPGGDPSDPASGQRRMRPFWLAVLAGVVTVLAIYGAWSRFSSGGAGEGSAQTPGELLRQSQAAGTSLTAVGRTKGLPQACTVWLLETGAPPQSQAHALTGARCVGQVDAASVMVDQDVSDASVEFNAIAPATSSGQPDLVVTPIDSVEWASVRGTDLAVLRLGATYEELAGRGVRPIDPVAALEEGAEILIAGVPVEGIAPSQQFLRGSRCQVGETGDILEAGLLGIDAQASDCAGILEGSAGSPAFNKAGDAVAMVTTTTIGATQTAECALGLACQVSDDGGISVKGDTSYMVPVSAVAACFQDGELSLGGDCMLEDPELVVAARADVAIARPGTVVRIRLTGELPAGFASTAGLEVKQGELGTVECRAPEGWLGAAQAAALAAAEAGDVEAGASAAPAVPTPTETGSATASEAATVPVASPGADIGDGPDVAGPTQPGPWSYPVLLPDEEGFTLVCVGSAAQPTPVVIEADGTAPDPASIELTVTPVEAGVTVQPVSAPPELTRFRWVSGPAGSIDCATAEGYVQYRGIPATVQAADLPSTICVIGIDSAGNESDPAEITVE